VLSDLVDCGVFSRLPETTKVVESCLRHIALLLSNKKEKKKERSKERIKRKKLGMGMRMGM
jgi:hypothetical protein